MRSTVRETNPKKHLALGHNLRVLEGRWVGGWGTWMIGMKEGMGWNEHWVFNATESTEFSLGN